MTDELSEVAEERSERGTAVFSPCRTYRYMLERTVRSGAEMYPPGANGRQGPPASAVAFVLLNPSTADAFQDDPTIRRCMGYARDWGYDSLYVLNIFALRSTDPKGLYAAADPVGQHADAYIKKVMARVDRVVCGWGEHGRYRKRGEWVFRLIQQFHCPMCLRTTQSGEPNHPLRLPRTLQPVQYLRSSSPA